MLSFFLIPLFLTILIELLAYEVIRKFFIKHKYSFVAYAIVAANLATNPGINLLTSLFNPLRELIFLELGMELIVVLIEAGIFYIIYKEKFGRLLAMSFIINLCSYAVGLLLF